MTKRKLLLALGLGLLVELTFQVAGYLAGGVPGQTIGLVVGLPFCVLAGVLVGYYL